MRGITKQSHSQKENSNGWVGEDGLLYKNVKKICFILMVYFFLKRNSTNVNYAVLFC